MLSSMGIVLTSHDEKMGRKLRLREEQATWLRWRDRMKQAKCRGKDIKEILGEKRSKKSPQ